MNELKKYVKTELAIVYIASDGTKHLKETEAIFHEEGLEVTRQQDRRWNNMKTNIAELVLEVLNKEGWGIFFKTEPIQVLPVQDSETTLYKVNEVNGKQLQESIEIAIQRKADERKVREWENHQTGQNQTDKELSTGTEKTLKDTKE